ncbi:interferon-induced GTP-binding protein mx2 [Moelleriella libera RCEF 2490]|uniref:Interferon-induced GTP-binding protein mx2 n=1 Tax=Moelleriella libera RCEF 2490 TaxID=1081109 RepID=A0A166NLL0_9HYPO|nr:interferon-induced GTP-binding protein mx2 [Moelleriella libera RCEF 2490]
MSSPATFLDDPRFSRSVELPADPSKNRPDVFHITYADYGHRDEQHPETETVLLFFGPLGGSRWIHVAKDAVAKRRRIRIIHPDRPGFGGTDAVDMKHRIQTWSGAVVSLLEHLAIKHVSVACHSGGTVYALDALLRYPQILNTENPYFAIGAPWIAPAQTDSMLMSLVQALPSGMINQTDKLANLVHGYVGPVISSSLGFVAKAFTKDSGAEQEAMRREGAKFEEELRTAIGERIFQHGIKGMSSDMLLLLRKDLGPAGWSDWDNYDRLVPRLAESLAAAHRKLRVHVFYAESDFMSSANGTRYFDDCWNETNRGAAIEYEATTVPGSDHDSIWNLTVGAMQDMFSELAAHSRRGEPASEPIV